MLLRHLHPGAPYTTALNVFSFFLGDFGLKWNRNLAMEKNVGHEMATGITVVYGMGYGVLNVEPREPEGLELWNITYRLL